MNAASTQVEQQAKISQVSGNVQLIRDGFFLPAQAGLVLLPGDRVVSDPAGKAVIEFTGVKDALIIENGAAATFNLEVVEMDQAPQWIATDLYGQGVYFESQQADTTADSNDTPDLFGLFGTGAEGGDSTGYPVLESLVFLGATAAIYSDNEDNNTSTTDTTSTNESGNGNNPGTSNPPPTTNPEPEPEPEPAAGPLDAVLSPVTDALDGLLSTLGAPSPLGSLAAPTQANLTNAPPAE